MDMDSETVAISLKTLGGALQCPTFEDWRKSFVLANVSVFDYGDENKLEYTTIHQSYVSGLEGYLAQSLPEGLSMSDLERALHQKPDLIDELDQAGNAAVKLMLEAGEFSAFKDMMLFEKQRLEDASDHLLNQTCTAGDHVPSLDGIREKCLRLGAMAQSEGWETLLQNDWMKLDKKAVEASERSSPHEIYLRGVWTMKLSVVECCDMMFTMTERRRAWDPNFRCATIQKGIEGGSDIVVTTELDFGFLLRMAGLAGKFTTRSLNLWNHPSPGTMTNALIPWNAVTDSFDPDNKLLTLKVTSIGPHPSQPDKCIMTTIESNKFGRMPKWILSSLMSVTAPKLMKGLEGRYIANVRKAGTSVDITPGDFLKSVP